MNCPACGHANPETARFCNECGGSLGVVCARCRGENPPRARFCSQCAAPLDVRKTERDPRAYTPKHLADKILQSKSALEGERKQVTVLFADVKGSLELSESLDPEEWHRILDRFFAILTDGVHRFEGTVNQYTGDGIMALFGAPIAHEDHAQRACYAALHLRDSLRSHADRVRADHGLSFGTRIGLNSGEVVVGKIGDDLRMDYTAQGQTVGLAQRMESLAQPDTIYLAPATADLVRGYFECRSLGPTRVRGLGEPIEVFELVTTGALRTRLDVSRTRGFSRFVGRAREMQALETALAQARDGDGRVVGIVGEPGVGKSRLCLEFVERCRATGITVFEAHCPAHGKTVPFLPFLEFLRGCFAISGADSAQVARDKVAGRLLLLDEHFREPLPGVFDFLGVPDPERPAPPAAPEVRQRQLGEFLRQLVKRRSERELALLLWDDVHWIDPGSDAFLAESVEAVRGTRTLLVANFRPEYHAPWMEHTHYERLPLHPLGPAATEALLQDLVGGDDSTRKLRERIRERTGGTPFFIEEIVQSLVETGALSGSRGDLRLAREADRLEIPDRVQTVLAARIDRLGEREKQMLRTAAVVGRSFAEPLLARVVDLPVHELAARLDALRARELIVQEALFPEARFAFKHPLTHQVAYESQLREPRAHTHRRVAEAIEELQPDRLDELAALVADHWEAAGATLESARWHGRAAMWASTNAPLEQRRRQARVRELAGMLPESDEAAQLGMRACSELLFLAWRVGSPLNEIETVFVEGRRFAERSGDRLGLATVVQRYSRALAAAGHMEAAVETGIEASTIAASTDDPRNQTLALFFLGDLYQQAGMNREAAALMDEVLASPHRLHMARYGRFVSLVWLGRLREARADAQQTLELGPRITAWGFPEIHESVHWWLGKLEAFAGRGEESLRCASRSAEAAAAKPGLGNTQCLSAWIMGVARLARGEWQASISALQSARALQQSVETLRQHEARILAPLAEAYLGAGDRERALETAEAARRAGRELGTRHWEAEACVAHARALLADGSTDDDSDAAERALERADELVRETGNVVLTPFILEQRATLALARGDPTAHERALHEAQRLYTEMDATGHAERLARELGLAVESS